jgi:predicted patatin/cPLA2 family phospholipase
MGCGVISKVNGNEVKNESELNILKRSEKRGDIFVEDLDDINNVLANRRNSIHFDIIKMADSMLKSANTNEQKASIFVSKADYYFQHACGLQKEGNFDYFAVFRKSQTNYILAYTLDQTNARSILGKAKCLLKLNQSQKAFEYLEKLAKNEKFVKNDDFWLLYGMSSRKCAKIWNGKSKASKKHENLDKALKCFELAKNHPDTKKEVQILDNLINIKLKYNSDIYKYASHLKTNSASYEVSTTMQNKEKNIFKIVSIDGGGLRGLFPAMILAEIEKRCNCYLADVFDMFAGVSTGGILTAGCTVPERIGSLKPKYSLGDVLEVYLDSSRTIFSDTNIANLIFSQKYSNQNLYNLTQNLIGDLRLSETLRSIIIPAVNCDGPLRTDYFKNYDARRNLEKDLYVKDVIMATTAAPVYFKPYKINGFGCYLDGSLTTQSPAKAAYEEALYRFNKTKEEIYILSLGTGLQSAMLFDENFGVSKSFLHWTFNIPFYIIIGQMHNTDQYLRTQLNHNYKRMQVYYEHFIEMDDKTQMPDLTDICTEYIEEKNDEINKIVEKILN